MPTVSRVAFGLLLLGAWSAQAAEPANAPPPQFDEAGLEFFEKKVRPILVARCFECHSASAKKVQGGLRLDTHAGTLAGGDTGPSVVPGKAAESLLIDAVKYGDLYQMPPKSKLPADEIAALVKWVELGVPWPTAPAGTSTADSPHAAEKVFDLAARRAAHWAWQPVKPQEVPAVKDASRVRDPVDKFVQAKLEGKGLARTAEADRRTLLRRVTFDLVGLPPTREEIEAFVRDESPQAYEAVVDRLLQSPHFGERWARHWLDLVRYAETRGHEFEPIIPNAWQYRDYVIRALNADVPYDRFVVEHLAGDLLSEPRRGAGGANESILGTGFWFLGEEVHSPVDVRQDETDRMDNRLDVMTKTFLGLTVACARCHDHKFDAISQRDYYALAGYLISGGYRQAMFETDDHNRQIAEQIAELRNVPGKMLAGKAAVAMRPGIERLAELLLAASDAAAAGITFERPADDVEEIKQTEFAAERKLTIEHLAAWVKELELAAGDATHPLHPFAVVAKETAANAGGAGPKVAERLRPIVERWKTELERSTTLSDNARVVDYTRGPIDPPRDWFPDGLAFGLRPVRQGELRFTTDEKQPLAGVFTTGGAVRDPLFIGLRAAGNTERDYGTLGNWDRGGRSLRTPESPLGSGMVWYLVRGPGRAYAAINSHLIVGGPLHGAVLLEWKGEPNRWQWVGHNLRAYGGNRFHVEFSPVAAEPLTVAMVVLADQPPPLPAEVPSRRLLSAFAAGPLDTLADVAKAYQRALLEAIALPGVADQGEIPPAWADEAPLVDWLLRNVELLALDQEATDDWRQAAAEFARRQAELVRQLKLESHTAPVMHDGTGLDEQLLVRGNPKTPAGTVPRRFLEALGGNAEEPAAAGSGRLQLARLIADPANPFVARVMVNRVWHHLFGRGIVASVDNFGVLGERPTHPELLDHLAAQFVAEGWSTKKLIRSLVLSSTYRAASQSTPAPDAIDPDNLLLHRMNLRRLEGEVIRDSLLAVSGRLDRQPFGPSVPIHLTAFMEGRGRPGSGPLDGAGRRSIYISVRRNFLSPMMLAFDTPSPFSTVGRRTVSNVPAQALILMNDPLVIEEARRWAGKTLAENQTPEQRIERLYLAGIGRPPSAEETAAALTFLAEQGARHGLPADKALGALDPWADLCHVMFNLKEFIYLQ